MSIQEIAEHLGRTFYSVQIKKNSLKIKLPVTEYAVYRGDYLVASGTAEECAQKLGVSKEYVRWLTTNSGKKRAASRKNPYKATTAVKL